jgi:glycosyltransferase involved in cell wall biosynthesis
MVDPFSFPIRHNEAPIGMSSCSFVGLLSRFQNCSSLCVFFSHIIYYYPESKSVVVSRLVYRKGVDYWLESFRHLSQARKRDFIIGGDGSKMPDVQETIERTTPGPRRVTGIRPHAQVRNVLVRGHVFF